MSHDHDDQKKATALSAPGLSGAPRRPKSALAGVPDVRGTVADLDVAGTAADVGVSAGALANPQVRKWMNIVRRQDLGHQFRQAREHDVCPICFHPGCPWPRSQEARDMGWRGRR